MCHTLSSRRRSFLIHAAAFLLGVALAIPAHAQTGDRVISGTTTQASQRPVIVAHVVDYAHVPPWLLVRTSREVRHAFDRIGVELDWRLDNDTSIGADGARHVSINILSKDMVRQTRAASRLPNGALASAVRAARRIFVFYPIVARIADEAGVGIEETLAYVVVHELGHLLLPSGHGEVGVMSRVLPMQGISSFSQFTRAEGQQIRQALEKRPPLRADTILAAAAEPSALP